MRQQFSKHPAYRVLASAVLVTVVALAGTALGSGSGSYPDTSSSDSGGDRPRPHPPGFTEGFGNEKVLSFRYDQQFLCTDDLGDDLDGPGHEGDGLRSERDPDEFQHPAMGPPGSPCIGQHVGG